MAVFCSCIAYIKHDSVILLFLIYNESFTYAIEDFAVTVHIIIILYYTAHIIHTPGPAIYPKNPD